MSEQTKISAQDILKRQIKQEQRIQELERKIAEQKDQKPESRVISVGRLGRELFPGRYVRETVKSAILTPDTDDDAYGQTEAVVSAEIDIPANEDTFLWGVDFSLYKQVVEGNVGLRNTWLPISGETVALYPFALGVAETDWRYTGRDFEWAMGEAFGKAMLQDEGVWRPSTDCRRDRYGYVLAEDYYLKGGTKFFVKARPLGSLNMWDLEEQQQYMLQVHLRCYEMIEPHNKRGGR